MAPRHPFFALRELFEAGEITKYELVERAGDFYPILEQYPQAIAGTAIRRIEITPDEVIFTLGDEEIRVVSPPGDVGTPVVASLYLGDYEPRERAALDDVARGAKVIYDIGGNIGFYALRWAKLNPGTKVHTFEPGKVNFAYLARNVELNELGDQIVANNFGMSDRSGTVEFFIPEELAGNSSMRNLANRPATHTEEVAMRTVDEWVAETGDVPEFIKCDVEGAELLVIKGATETLRNHKPRVHAELLRKWAKPFGYHPTEVIDFLAEFGYRCWAITETGLDPIEAITEETEETNFIFLDPEVHELP